MGCYFRNNVICSSSYERCKTCGWNPEVEKERIAKLMSGEVKTYLHITPETYKALQMRLLREGIYNDD